MLLAPSDVTLGLLAGGRATRLGGVDKAWLLRDGEPQAIGKETSATPAVAKMIVEGVTTWTSRLP